MLDRTVLSGKLRWEFVIKDQAFSQMGLCCFKSEDNCVSLPHTSKNTECPCAALSNRELIKNYCVIVFNSVPQRRCNLAPSCFLWPLFFYCSFGTVVKRNISSCSIRTRAQEELVTPNFVNVCTSPIVAPTFCAGAFTVCSVWGWDGVFCDRRDSAGKVCELGRFTERRQWWFLPGWWCDYWCSH